MEYKKMLVIILVTVVAMFGLMLTTSYAWYSFGNGATNFVAVTNNDDIEVSFLKGEYINQTVGVPIASTDVDKYSDKHQFTVRVKENVEDNDMMVTISLVEMAMDAMLWDANFKVDLYHQGKLIKSHSGDESFTASGKTTLKLDDVKLDDNIDNQFEIRIYLLDNGNDQSALMNKSFQAKVEVNVISRLKTTVTNWDSPDIHISSVTVDGILLSKPTIPTDGYYTMSASCEKGSVLLWDGFTKTITYTSGSKINDSCALTFTSATSTMYLNQVEPGSYVEYTGTNGCDGKSCEGQNANYESDLKMGYCYDEGYQFITNGWRVAYIKDDSAFLVSAGALECVTDYVENKRYITMNLSLSSNYYYGSGYSFDNNTGEYTLEGVSDSVLTWRTDYESIIANTPYTCKKTSSTATCTTMYEVIEYYSTLQGKSYTYENYDADVDVKHIPRLNQVARKYCNKKYAKGGVCDETTAWAMKAADFNNIIENGLSSCQGKYSDKTCGYTNILIDNGGYYWFTEKSSYATLFRWNPRYRGVNCNYYLSSDSNINVGGVRPVLYLESSVLVVGGSGTYEDPYKLSIGT